ncbi:M42 family metallopeptidase [Rubrobacter aplysinae]|uniref:M42 family metallopeptidase n=1 Tax=Rubrobacter aplysinae TaxID=909625 RepID=UPI00128D966C|nr:M20/M25/M40 family metallo-hydrolase [Rubrobacter aplysinae]
MDELLIDRLGDLCGAHAVSGYEGTLAAEVRREAEGYTPEVRTDTLGNVIAHVPGDGPRVMVAAHLDEIGLMVSHIDERGFLFFAPVGGHRPQNLFARACTVKTDDGSLVPGLINHMKPGRPQAIETLPEIDEFFIDVGASTKQEAEEMGLEIGNTVSIDYEFRRLGRHRLMAKALDDRALVLIQLEAMRRISESGPEAAALPDLYFAFTTQEEVGLRGARTAAYSIDPDYAVALDITVANDLPGSETREAITTLDAGPGIKMMDRLSGSHIGIISDPEVARGMKSVAREHDIPFQPEVFMAGSTDAAAIQLERAGTAAGALLLPTRYVHAHEVVSMRDVAAMTELLLRYLESLAQ